MDYLTTIFNTRDPSEKQLKLNSPIRPQWNPLAKPKFHFRIYQDRQNMQKFSPPSTPVSFQLEKKWWWMHSHVWQTQSRDKKNNVKVIEVYWYPMNILWHFPLHYPSQYNQQSNMISHSTSKNWCQHKKPMEPRHPRAYCPTSQQ